MTSTTWIVRTSFQFSKWRRTWASPLIAGQSMQCCLPSWRPAVRILTATRSNVASRASFSRSRTLSSSKPTVAKLVHLEKVVPFRQTWTWRRIRQPIKCVHRQNQISPRFQQTTFQAASGSWKRIRCSRRSWRWARRSSIWVCGMRSCCRTWRGRSRCTTSMWKRQRSCWSCGRRTRSSSRWSRARTWTSNRARARKHCCREAAAQTLTDIPTARSDNPSLRRSHQACWTIIKTSHHYNRVNDSANGCNYKITNHSTEAALAWTYNRCRIVQPEETVTKQMTTTCWTRACRASSTMSISRGTSPSAEA